MKTNTWRVLLVVTAIGGMMMACATAGETHRLPPRFVNAPGPQHALERRKFTGIPSLAVSRKGRLWATWYAGKTPAEDKNNYVVIATSGDRGKTWSERFVIDPDGGGPVRAFDPELWMDPTGRLWAFWAQHIRHKDTAGVWAMTCEEPEKEAGVWSRPLRLTDGVMMCKPVVLSSGEWVLPVSAWSEKDQSARAVVSTDQGESWAVRGACNVPVKDRNHDEHMIVERSDKSLWMLVRTRYGIGESISRDRGKTWSALKSSSIQHPAARFYIGRLASGKLLLVKHGSIDKKTGRSHLMAFLSEDDGKNWTKGLLLDERNNVSYPDGQQGSDGTIYIVYDRERTKAREILMATFTEEDILAGEPVSRKASLRMVVSAHPVSRTAGK